MSVVMSVATFPFSVEENGRMTDLRTHVRAHPSRTQTQHVRTRVSRDSDTEGEGRRSSALRHF